MAKVPGVKEEIVATSRGWKYKQLYLDIKTIKTSSKNSQGARNKK